MVLTEIEVGEVTRIVMEILQEQFGSAVIPIGISNRHIHLTAADYHMLFGDLPFEKLRDLTQPGEFVSNRKAEVKGPKSTLTGVRILGPFRETSQVELSKTDARLLGADVPVRMSGDIKGSSAVALIGPAGTLHLPQGAIVAQRHVHMSPGDAARFGVKDGDRIDVRVNGERPTIFCDTVVRVKDSFVLEMHVDHDEANSVSGPIPLTGQLVRP